MNRRWRWGTGAWAALTSTAPYVDLEGGIRSQKTTALCAHALELAVAHPGIKILLWRWTDDSLDTQLKPLWRQHCEQNGIELHWHADESYDALSNGSIVYLRGLKPSEDTRRYGKLRGLTLAFIGGDQAEEAPGDFWPELVGRISQPGMPHQIWLTPQPVNEDHWIAKRFPESNPNPEYVYIRTNVYDNRVNVGDDYIRQLEAAYPEGSAQRRTLLEGRRGLSTAGDPVYAGVFSRLRHVKEIGVNPDLPLYEGWDYGQSHPCVVWVQFTPTGKCAVLGAVMGLDLSLDQFAPVALSFRERWCPRPTEVYSTGDPAGLQPNTQGLPGSVAEILAEVGVSITGCTGGNAPEMRDRAIKGLSGYMNRIALDNQPAFVVSPRSIVVARGKEPEPSSFLVDGFEGGYIWDSRQYLGPRANIRRPKKDGWFDHAQNCVEYVLLAFGPALVTQQDLQAAQRRALRASQIDHDSVLRPTGTHGRLRRG